MHASRREREKESTYRRERRRLERGEEDRKRIAVQRNTHQCKITINEIDDCIQLFISLLKVLCISSSI